MTAAEVRELLGLEPLAPEGGFFVETYRATGRLPAGAPFGGRSFATAIYYLLTPETFSAIHRLATDEVYHFYLGDPVELLLLPPGGPGRLVLLGTDLAAGMRPQAVVPGGVWQGSRLVAGGSYALLGTTVAPGFDPADYQAGSREALMAGHPDLTATIAALTR